MVWLQVAFLILKYGPDVIAFIKKLREHSDDPKDFKDCIGELCQIEKRDLAPLREALKKRREARRK